MTIENFFFSHIFDKIPILFNLLDFVNLEKEFLVAVLNFCRAQKTFSYTLPNSYFKNVVVLYCGSSGATRTNFSIESTINNKHFPNSLFRWKRCFQHFYFKIRKNPLVNNIFLPFSWNSIFQIFVKMLSWLTTNHFYYLIIIGRNTSYLKNNNKS